MIYSLYPLLKVVPGISLHPNPEVTMTGTFKQKDQDVCVVPSRILNEPELITWGPLNNSSTYSDYGSNKEQMILATNVRSQFSSINKNIDTLFERMISESLNLHDKYPQLVLGELYLIPVYEYDDVAMTTNNVRFKPGHTNIEKFIQFFSYLNNYTNVNEPYKYSKAGLIVVDFRQDIPKIYESTEDLKQDNLVSESFSLELADLSPTEYTYNLLQIYDQIWGLSTLD